jgi:hypothetical protein
MTRIFASDLIHFLQNSQTAESHVFKIADGRTYQVQTAGSACGHAKNFAVYRGFG